MNNIQLVDETQNISRINYEKNEIINQQKEILYGPETNIATQPYNTQDYSRIVNNSINASLLKSPKKSMISLSPMRTFSKSPKKAPISPIKSPRKSSKGYRNLGIYYKFLKNIIICLSIKSFQIISKLNV